MITDVAKKAVHDKLESQIKTAQAKLDTLKARAETATTFVLRDGEEGYRESCKPKADLCFSGGVRCNYRVPVAYIASATGRGTWDES
jgi:hypothetical protein